VAVQPAVQLAAQLDTAVQLAARLAVRAAPHQQPELHRCLSLALLCRRSIRKGAITYRVHSRRVGLAPEALRNARMPPGVRQKQLDDKVSEANSYSLRCVNDLRKDRADGALISS